MPIDSTALYLSFLKKALQFQLWDEPPVPLELYRSALPKPLRWLLTQITRLLRPFGLGLVKYRGVTQSDRDEGRIWPVFAHTMLGEARLNNVELAVETVLRENIPGDLIEAGVWRGGACILMRAILAVHGVSDRRVILADSFEGLPPPDIIRYPQDRGFNLHQFRALAISESEVRENFRRYELLDEQVVFLKGFFEETLPVAPVQQLAVLRLDGDMYGSTMVSLENLYPKLSPGGFCIIDDYWSIQPCRQAVEDYRSRMGISEPLETIDWAGVYWRKPQ